MNAVSRAARALVGDIEITRPLWVELRGLRLNGPRARQAMITAASVALATALALLGHMDLPWWSAISGFMSVQTTRPGSIERATLRITGTAGGAIGALAIAPWVVADPVIGTLCLFAATTLGMIGFLVSPHGYAWLFFGITLSLVVLLSINDPSQTLHYAFYRTFEVVLGTVSALTVVVLLGSGDPAVRTPPPPGWHDLLGSQWPSVMHAVRAGATIALLPWIWSLFELPGLTQMAITVAAVMAIPVLSGHALDDGRAVAGRVVHRCLGCALGGTAALLVLAFSINEFIPWIAVLAAGVWLGAQVQASTRGVGYLGTQATVVWIMMLVQGWGPPDSILPAVNRLAGMLAGIVILLIVSLLLWPEPEAAADLEDSARSDRVAELGGAPLSPAAPAEVTGADP